MWVDPGPDDRRRRHQRPGRRPAPSEFIGEDLTRTPDQEPANALRLAGVDPRDVESVVLTHLHWDHAGNCDLFPDAPSSSRTPSCATPSHPGRFFRKSFLAPASGWGTPPYLVPNLADRRRRARARARAAPRAGAGGHTPGSQALVVDTEHGSFSIAGDAICTYANIDQDLPPGLPRDVDASMDSIDRLRAAADHLLPSHDYAVLTDGAGDAPSGAAHGADRVAGRPDARPAQARPPTRRR